MTITLKVPSIACDACANTITKAIQTQQPEAQVNVDVPTKIVKVETEASEETIQQIILSVGHEIEG